MQAIILAAGMGKRLKELTKNNTKCMVKVGGVTLIERLLRQLEPYGLSRIVIVFGYKGKTLVDYVQSLNIATPVEFVENPIYDKTNNIYSLYLAKNYLAAEDTLLFESDLIMEDSVIETIINDRRPTLALVDKYESWMDGTCVRLTEGDEIADFISGNKLCFSDTSDYYKTVNVYKFSKHFSKDYYIPFLEAYCTALGLNEYYEQVLKVIVMLDDSELRALRLSGENWCEIDDIQDLDIAESKFATGNSKTKQIQGRYGGYWRYPKMLDFCYLVNPFYPPNSMVEELKASFDTLIRQYPSGMKVNSLLASKKFGVKQEYIAIGNGAAELIKSLCVKLNGKVGIIRPTFEEYPNRLSRDSQVVFEPTNQDFSYTADDLIKFFDGKVNALVLINPDNPSGNYITHGDMLKILEWAHKQNIRLVVDESFVDFADDKDATLITNDILEAYPSLVVVKSISKCYGVPGLRLGVICSGDEKLIDFIKKDVGIWNINSIAEFYMQIEEKYKNDYENALKAFSAERARFYNRLSEIKGVYVIPSQANYFMIRLNVCAADVVDKLLGRNIFIKDLTAKTGGQYIRIAVRDKSDNDRLVEALSAVLNEIE